MELLRQVAPLRIRLEDWRRAGERIALVPTMGNLHAGHMGLVRQAAGLARRVVVSVFVNPTQFGPGEDFSRYPRTPEDDRQRLLEAGADMLFMPSDGQVYPGGTEGATRVSVPELSKILCGAARPGHFDGVTSVCCRLFNIVQPDVAVFGQKDYQQLVILRRMVADLHLRLELVAGRTAREADGLALSSRNQYLDPAQRRQAPAIYRALADCRTQLAAGERDFGQLEHAGLQVLASAGLVPEYFAIRRMQDLAEPEPQERGLVILAAARLGTTRLIDNLLLDESGSL
ncbi:MAG: pantoate--beta-alanine ligase [Chromatiales bacterium]|nr:pantoate--beta-alanine ligase [Chromatiales bacterium]